MRNALLASMLPLVAAGTLHAAPYTFTDLNMLGEYGSIAYSINDLNQVFGTQLMAIQHEGYKNIEGVATVWSNGSTALMPGYETGLYSSGPFYGINNNGDALVSISGNHLYSAVWSTKDGTVTDLKSDNFEGNIASDINNSGQIIGSDATSVLWNDKTSYPINISQNETFRANAINNSGQIAGDKEIAPGTYHAVIQTGGNVNDLGTLGGNNSCIIDLSDNGYAIGSSEIADGQTRYFLYKDGEMNQLGYVPGGISPIDVNSVNNFGQSVGSLSFGTQQDQEQHAILWNGTRAVDLNNYLDADSKNAGWVLTEANDINNNGWIVGMAHNTITNEDHAFMFSTYSVSPVPEPSNYTLLLAGLGLLGFALMHRRTGEH